MHSLDSRIQAYLRAHALRMPDNERVGPFLASFDPVTDNLYRNYAVPDDGASPTADEIAALEQAFLRRGRKPRLEYIAAAAPGVEPVLEACGFTVEKRYPVLTCTQDRLRGVASPGIDIAFALADSDIVAAAKVGAEAYGNDDTHPEPLRRLVAQGGALAIARDAGSGAVVGLGMATPMHEGVSEIAGIGVAPAHRGRGIAGALTAFLTREAFGRGATLAWLTPGHDAAERIYTRAGFARASEQLHISKG
jgi:predicted GNAT family acetyltransferase